MNTVSLARTGRKQRSSIKPKRELLLSRAQLRECRVFSGCWSGLSFWLVDLCNRNVVCLVKSAVICDIAWREFITKGISVNGPDATDFKSFFLY